MNLFEFVNKDENDLISSFNQNDISILLRLLKLYKISLREYLGLESDITFGFEYEFAALNPTIIET